MRLIDADNLKYRLKYFDNYRGLSTEDIYRIIDDCDAVDTLIISENATNGFSPEDISDAQTIDAVVIPKDATNGDVIKLVFPNIEIADTEVLKHVYTSVPYGELVGANIDCMRDWWNARYTTDRPTCEDCHNFGTVNCSETYREPCKNDVCETFERR